MYLSCFWDQKWKMNDTLGSFNLKKTFSVRLKWSKKRKFTPIEIEAFKKRVWSCCFELYRVSRAGGSFACTLILSNISSGYYYCITESLCFKCIAYIWIVLKRVLILDYPSYLNLTILALYPHSILTQNKYPYALALTLTLLIYCYNVILCYSTILRFYYYRFLKTRNILS